MFKWVKENKGLTLIEILVSLAILGMIMVPLGSMFVASMKLNNNSKMIMLANQLAQGEMESVKASASIQIGTKEYLDHDTGMMIQTKIEKYREDTFNLPGEGGSSEALYDTIIDFSNVSHGKVQVSDGNSENLQVFDIKDNSGTKNIDIVIEANKIIIGEHPYHNKDKIEILFSEDPAEIMIKNEGNYKYHFRVYNPINKSINFYVSDTAISSKKFDIKTQQGSSKKVTVNSYKIEETTEDVHMLYKITVIIKDQEDISELVKLVSLKKI